MPWVPLLLSSVHVAEISASIDALPARFVDVLWVHSNESLEETVGDVAFQYLIPLDQLESSVSKPVFLAKLAPQLPSFEPHEAYPITLLIFVRNCVSSSKITVSFIEFRVELATYKSSFQYL